MHKAFARKIDGDWGQLSAVVCGKDARGVRVSTGALRLDAQRALSCLVEPEVGDRVLVARSGETGEAFVLAVLAREGDAPVTLLSPRDTALRTVGKLTVIAEDATIAAPTFSLHTAVAKIQATQAVAVLGSVDAVLDRLVQCAKRVFRVVEEVDHLRAGRVDYEAEGTLSLHAHDTTVTSEGLVKVDGEQIQLG